MARIPAYRVLVPDSHKGTTTSNEGAAGQAARPGPADPGGRPERPPARLRLSMRAVLAAAAGAGRQHAARILPVAIAVSLVTAAGDILVDHFVDPHNATAYTIAGLGTTAVSLLGTVFLSGLVCRLTTAAQAGRGATQPGRSGPVAALAAADPG